MHLFLVLVVASGLLGAGQGVEAIRFGIKASTAALILQQAQVTTAFDIGVGPAEGAPRSPEEVFEKISPHVVLIEAK